MDFLRSMITGNTACNNLEYPSVYNAAAGRSEQCSSETPGAGWSLVVTLSADEDKRLHNLMSKHFKSVAQRDSRLGEYAGIQAKMMAEIQSILPQQPQPSQQEGPPSPNDPTGSGGGNIKPGNAPEPGAAGFTGAGGGDNAGQQSPQAQPGQGVPVQ